MVSLRIMCNEIWSYLGGKSTKYKGNPSLWILIVDHVHAWINVLAQGGTYGTGKLSCENRCWNCAVEWFMSMLDLTSGKESLSTRLPNFG